MKRQEANVSAKISINVGSSLKVRIIVNTYKKMKWRALFTLYEDVASVHAAFSAKALFSLL